MATIDMFLTEVGCNEGAVTVQAEKSLRQRLPLRRVHSDQTLNLEQNIHFVFYN